MSTGARAAGTYHQQSKRRSGRLWKRYAGYEFCRNRWTAERRPWTPAQQVRTV